MNCLRSAIMALCCCDALFCDDGFAQSIRYASRPGLQNSVFGFELPPPIGLRDLDRYGEILNLSEAQRKFVGFLFEDYAGQSGDLDKRFVPLLLQAAQPIVEAQGQSEPRLPILTALLNVRSLEQDFVSELEKKDDQFFTRLEVVLAEPQRPLMRRVLMHRQRARCLLKLLEIRKAHIDLSQILEDASLPPTLLADLDPLLWEYEQLSTPKFVAVEKRRRDANMTLVALDLKAQFDDFGSALDWSNPESFHRAFEARAQEIRVVHDLAVAQVAVADLNDEWLPRITAAMPVEIAGVLRQAYLSAAYLRVYPDRIDPKFIFESCLDSQDNNPELQRILERVWNEYRSSYQSICDLLEGQSDRWQRQRAFENHITGWQEHNRDMRRWTEERMKKSADFVKRMEGLLGDSMAPQQAKMIEDWKTRFASQFEQLRRYPRDYPGGW